jgi:hypothetical protein
VQKENTKTYISLDIFGYFWYTTAFFQHIKDPKNSYWRPQKIAPFDPGFH